jgi:hypothetical protein
MSLAKVYDVSLNMDKLLGIIGAIENAPLIIMKRDYINGLYASSCKTQSSSQSQSRSRAKYTNNSV